MGLTCFTFFFCEKTEPGIMDQGPRLLSEPMLEKVMITGIVIQVSDHLFGGGLEYLDLAL
jgi:hypothetical protein